VRKLVGQRASHLDRGTFAADRRTEQVGHDRAAERERRYTKRDSVFRLVGLVDKQVVTCLDALAEGVLSESDREAGERQKRDEPGMCLANESCAFESANRRNADAEPARAVTINASASHLPM
jgi:hypothetical protein